MSKTFYFNKAKKPNLYQANSTVGPGQYKIKPFIGICDGLKIEKDKVLYVWFQSVTVENSSNDFYSFFESQVQFDIFS